MEPILVFQHWPSEGPGYLSEVFQRMEVPWHFIEVNKGTPIPNHLGSVSALVFMGGPMSVNDSLPWIAQEISLIQLAHTMGIPVLGHCLGGQLIAKALGGMVVQNPVCEIGWFPVTQEDNLAAKDWFQGLPKIFEVFHWHGETFSIPLGATHLLSSPHCQNQGFAIGNTLALQCHVEMTEELVHHWTKDSTSEIAVPTKSIQSKTEIIAGLRTKIKNLHLIADVIYTRWLRSCTSPKPSLLTRVQNHS
ncbi:GMP synthase (glutamine-hydrolysing) [Gammaproteobacteria bacterium]